MRTPVTLAYCLTLLLAPPASRPAVPGVKLPMPLAALEQARAALETGEITWRTRCNLPNTDEGTVFDWYSPEGERYYSSRFTASEYMVEDRGDPEGVVWRIPPDAPDPSLAYRAKRYLLTNGARWEHRDQHLLAEVREGTDHVVNSKLFGLVPDLATSGGLRDALGANVPGPQYEIQMVGGLCRVLLTFQGSPWTKQYLLDPDCDWNPRSVSLLLDSEVVQEALCTLKRYGDVWFPERVEIYDKRHKEGSEPAYVIDVLTARFNDPDQPHRLTPESIGVEVGTAIVVYPRGSPQSLAAQFGWDGKSIVDRRELLRRIKAGELKTGPGVQMEILRTQALGLQFQDFESAWEAYVRAFIQKYRLDAEQAERAYRVLRSCIAAARQYCEKHAPELRQVRIAVAELHDPTIAADRQSDDLRKLARRMVRLEEPLLAICYEQLLPRLEEIPTRAQRRLAAQQIAAPALDAP